MTTLLRAVLATVLAVSLASCDGMGDHSNGQTLGPGNTKLQSGIARARAGIVEYQANQTAAGLASIDEGRGMMGQGMVMMGLGCCIGDGTPGALGDGGADSCASSMGAGAPDMVQGLGKFDSGRAMMGSGAAGDAQGMAAMAAAMGMMEKGSTDMMGSGGGMGGMM